MLTFRRLLRLANDFLKAKKLKIKRYLQYDYNLTREEKEEKEIKNDETPKVK